MASFTPQDGLLSHRLHRLKSTVSGLVTTAADMVLASVQTVTGAKTFNDGKLLLQNVANTFYGVFTNTNTANRTYTLPDADGTVALTSGFASGVYNPTRSAEANLDSNVTMSEAQYLRVGSTVTVSGRFTADPTLTATTTSFEITLPVASNLGAAEDCAGVAFCGSIVSMGAEITGVAANNTAQIAWKASDITSQSFSYVFSYQVI